MLPLGLLNSGEKAEVVAHTSGHASSRIEDMGLRTGKAIEILNNEGRGPLLIKLDESRIAICRGMAMKIMVRRIA